MLHCWNFQTLAKNHVIYSKAILTKFCLPQNYRLTPHNSSLERVLGAMSAERNFIETMDHGLWSKMISGEMEMASQEKQNGSSLCFVAPSNEESQVQTDKFE